MDMATFVGVQEYLFNEIIKMHPQVDLPRKNSETPQASCDQTLGQGFRGFTDQGKQKIVHRSKSLGQPTGSEILHIL